MIFFSSDFIYIINGCEEFDYLRIDSSGFD